MLKIYEPPPGPAPAQWDRFDPNVKPRPLRLFDPDVIDVESSQATVVVAPALKGSQWVSWTKGSEGCWSREPLPTEKDLRCFRSERLSRQEGPGGNICLEFENFRCYRIQVQKRYPIEITDPGSGEIELAQRSWFFGKIKITKYRPVIDNNRMLVSLDINHQLVLDLSSLSASLKKMA